MKRIGRYILTLVFWLGLWTAAAAWIGKALLLPSPFAVGKCLLGLAGSGTFWMTLGVSLLRIAAGVAAAILLGVILGVLTSWLPWLGILTKPLRTVMRATPVASFIILALLWIGRDILPAVIAGIMVLPVVWTSVESGIQGVDRELWEVTQVFRLSLTKRVSKLYLPTVMPWLLTACRNAIGLGWKAGVAAEVLTVPAVSIGRQLYESKLYLETEELFAWTLAVILCSVLIEKAVTQLLKAAERKDRK